MQQGRHVFPELQSGSPEHIILLVSATANAASTSPPELPQTPAGTRLYSLDVFRGFTMVWMISEGFGRVHFRDHPVLGPIAAQFTHADWHGMHAWDLVQPFFMFIVGVAMPFAFREREARGQSWSLQFQHVLKRCALLILLGTMARSIQAGRPVLDVINVLAQIAFTYVVAFLILKQRPLVQAGAALGLLSFHTLLYLFAQAPGVTGPWDKNANIGWYLDGLILGKHWGGGYATINCVSSASATIAGLIVGQLLAGTRSAAEKIRLLIAGGGVAVAAGLTLNPVIPINKKIWTMSFAFASIGITLAVVALCYWWVDVRRRRVGTSVFAMVGANSIFIYLFHEILGRWMMQTGQVFTGWAIEWSRPFGQLLNALLVIGFQVYVCYWLYQRRIFFRL